MFLNVHGSVKIVSSVVGQLVMSMYYCEVTTPLIPGGSHACPAHGTFHVRIWQP